MTREELKVLKLELDQPTSNPGMHTRLRMCIAEIERCWRKLAKQKRRRMEANE